MVLSIEILILFLFCSYIVVKIMEFNATLIQPLHSGLFHYFQHKKISAPNHKYWYYIPFIECVTAFYFAIWGKTFRLEFSLQCCIFLFYLSESHINPSNIVKWSMKYNILLLKQILANTIQKTCYKKPICKSNCKLFYSFFIDKINIDIVLSNYFCTDGKSVIMLKKTFI